MHLSQVSLFFLFSFFVLKIKELKFKTIWLTGENHHQTQDGAVWPMGATWGHANHGGHGRWQASMKIMTWAFNWHHLI